MTAVVRDKDVLHLTRKRLRVGRDETTAAQWTDWLMAREAADAEVHGAMRLATLSQVGRAALFDRAVAEDLESHPASAHFKDADVEVRMVRHIETEYCAQPKEAQKLAHEWAQAEFDRRDPMKRALADGWTEEQFLDYCRALAATGSSIRRSRT